MLSPTETEIKLALPPAKAQQLQHIPLLRGVNGAKSTAMQVSTYFDTRRFKLKRKGLVLRVRRTGAQHIQTIKTEGEGVIDRHEWETELDGDALDFAAARGTALAPLLTRKLRRKLRPVFETRVRRTTYPLQTRDAEVEVTLDRGKIIAGRQSTPLCEIEIELKSGDKSDLFRVARSVARAMSAELAMKSKSQRGYELLDGNDALAEKAEPIALSAELPARDAFRVIAASCLKQVIGNKRAVLAGDPDGVHQMRIGLRRLRAAMSLFSDVLGADETPAIKAKLKWLTDELSPAREFEVFLTSVVTPVRQLHTQLAGMQSLSHELAEQHRAAVERARKAVGSERFRSLVIDVAAWLETGAWLDPSDLDARARGDQPIGVMAAAQMSLRWRKIRKRSRLLTRLDPYRRHKLRIQAKKLRYAAEFFETVFPGKKAARRRKAFLNALRGMQDCLGDLNDISVHESMMAELAGASKSQGVPRGEGPKRAYVAGLLSGHEDARLAAVLATAKGACKELAKARRFWS